MDSKESGKEAAPIYEEAKQTREESVPEGVNDTESESIEDEIPLDNMDHEERAV